MIKKIAAISIIFGVLLPGFSFAQIGNQAPQMPETLEEAKEVGETILGQLPEAMKRVWQEEALPLWQKMGNWLQLRIEPYWQKFLGLLGKEVEKRKPAIKEEFQKEKQEMKESAKEELPGVGKSLWERFQELIK